MNNTAVAPVNDTSFTRTLVVDQTPEQAFDAINNVRGWWSETIEGNTQKAGDEFTYRYKDMHYSHQKLVEVVPNKKVVWLVTDSSLNFIEDKTEWNGTKVIFEITAQDNKTKIRFTHEGLLPSSECFEACSGGWTYYLASLFSLITTGKGKPAKKTLTTQEVAARFHELAQQEKWFEIQDELFAENVKSIEPQDSKWMKNAEGKSQVRQKAEQFVQRIEAAHKRFTTAPIVAANHFAVGREVDITVNGFGRIQINQIMMYEVKDGQIVLEQFYY